MGGEATLEKIPMDHHFLLLNKNGRRKHKVIHKYTTNQNDHWMAVQSYPNTLKRPCVPLQKGHLSFVWKQSKIKVCKSLHCSQYL